LVAVSRPAPGDALRLRDANTGATPERALQSLKGARFEFMANEIIDFSH
jgi:hypothetical protein